MGRGPDHTGEGTEAVKRRLPSRATEVERLATSNERFRAICDDVADLERALGRVDQLPEQARAARHAECVELIGELIEEIVGELDQAKIIPLTRRNPAEK